MSASVTAILSADVLVCSMLVPVRSHSDSPVYPGISMFCLSLKRRLEEVSHLLKVIWSYQQLILTHVIHNSHVITSQQAFVWHVDEAWTSSQSS